MSGIFDGFINGTVISLVMTVAAIAADIIFRLMFGESIFPELVTMIVGA